MKAQFERVRDYFVTQGEEMDRNDYNFILKCFDNKTPTDDEIIESFEDYLDSLEIDEDQIDLGVKGR